MGPFKKNITQKIAVFDHLSPMSHLTIFSPNSSPLCHSLKCDRPWKETENAFSVNDCSSKSCYIKRNRKGHTCINKSCWQTDGIIILRSWQYGYLRDANVFFLFLCSVIRTTRDTENEKFCYKIMDTEMFLVKYITFLAVPCSPIPPMSPFVTFSSTNCKNGVDNKLLEHQIPVEKCTCSAN